MKEFTSRMKIYVIIGFFWWLKQAVCSVKVNISDIQYHYDLLCGPTDWDYNYFHDNVIGFCPKCFVDRSCWLRDDCCPQTGLKHQPGVCSNVVFQMTNVTEAGKMTSYKMIQSCPEGTSKDLLTKCLKNEFGIFEKIKNFPVTAKDTFVTFRNMYCAKCNKVIDFVPWQMDVQCERKYDPFMPIKEMLSFGVKNGCVISYKPPTLIQRIITPCVNYNLIDKCNLTGTWRTYNQNIDIACRTLDTVFPPFKNVFCCMCNPPAKPSSSHSIIDTCAGTHYSRKHLSKFEGLCKNGGMSDATFPYKNIFCYMCNLNSSIRDILRPYSLSISDKVIYNLIGANEYEDIIKQFFPCSSYFAKVKMRVECTHSLPISLFSRNITNEILEYGSFFSCNISQIPDVKFSLSNLNLTVECGNARELNLISACRTDENGVFYMGNDSEGYCDNRPAIENYCRYPGSYDFKPMYGICSEVQCKSRDYTFIYPLEDAVCACCKSRFTSAGGPTGSFPAIFSSNFYSPEECSGDKIFDPLLNECRDMDCYPGKRLIGTTCEMMLPFTRYPKVMLYILPLYFNPIYNIENITTEIENYVQHKYNIYSTFCFISVSSFLNESSSYYVAFVPMANRGSYSTILTENLLINATDGLLKESFDNFTTDYFDKISDINVSGVVIPNTRSCETNGKKTHFVSRLLTCRHVLFKPNEYVFTPSRTTVRLTNYGTELRFYEYSIDDNKYLRICKERYDNILESLDGHFSSYTLIMIIFSAISLLSLVLTLITYSLFEKLRTLPGKNLMNLVLCLFLYDTFFLVLMVINNPSSEICQFIGIVTHFFMLCCFGSFTACTVHMFRIFGQTKLVLTVTGTGRNHRLFNSYMFCIYASSFMIVTGTVISVYVTSGMTSLGYGRNGRCFISTITTFVATVLVPLIITFVVNITLFVITTYRLKQKVDISAELTNKRKSNKKEMLIFIKLFITTGCMWILLLINFFVNNMSLYVAISGFSTLQGIFIFIAYVCNRRICGLYKDAFSGMFNFVETRYTKPNSESAESYMHSDTTNLNVLDYVKPQTNQCKLQTDNIKLKTDRGKPQTDQGKPQIDNGNQQTDIGKLQTENDNPLTTLL